MEQFENEDINGLYKQVAELSQHVNEYINNAHLVGSQIKKTLQPTGEINEQCTYYLKLGTENSKLFADFTENLKDTSSLLNTKNEIDFKELNMNPFFQNIVDIENYICKNSEILRYFKIVTIGLRRVIEIAKTGKYDICPETSDTTMLAFSDFLPKNPEVATSSPLH